jgi:TRAP transporter TAXI family solute receptor
MDHLRLIESDIRVGRRNFLKLSAAFGGAMLMGTPNPALGQTVKRLSIATGGMGGVYFPMGGGIASLISKYIPGVEASAEVTAASVDNCKLVAAGKSDMGIVMADVAYDALMGMGKFKDKLPITNLAMLYSNLMHVVTIDGKGIKSVSDLKGKKISTGAPGSGTEIKALRVLEAYGIDPDKDVSRDRLGASESAGALKDGKIDAYFWDGGVPTASVLDIASTPGTKISLLNHGEAVDKMTAKYGPVYFKAEIPKGVYSGVDADVSVAAVGNILIANENMDPKLAYDILNVIFGHLPELIAVHKEAENIKLSTAAVGSPLPFQKGAIQFYKDKGTTIKA